MAQVQFMDSLLKEYLLYRGFFSTLKALDNELKTEKDQNFRAEKVIEQLQQHVQNHDLKSLRSLWSHLDNYLFNKLENNYATAVKKLENSLLKFYLITAWLGNRHDKITEFYGQLASELQQQIEWKDWFYFPFCKNPEETPSFVMYFSKQWQDTFLFSLRNFLSTVYQCLPQPTFVRAEHEAHYIRRLHEENALLKTRLQQQQQQQATCCSQNSLCNSNATTDGTTKRRSFKPQQSFNEIVPFDISPPGHVVDDFCIIATEVNNVAQTSDAQARGLKLLIRNISTSTSPVLGRREPVFASTSRGDKRRSGSVGRNWI